MGIIYPLLLGHFYPLLLGHFTPCDWDILPLLIRHFYPLLWGHFTPCYCDISPFLLGFSILFYSFISAIYMSVMVLVITFLDNYLILLVIFKIVWTLFVWVNIRDLYTSGKIYGGHHHVRRKLRSDILY